MAHRSLNHLRDILESEGTPFSELAVDADSLPLTDRQGRSQAKAFRHTPEPLIRSWRCARQLMRATSPGDMVLASDREGLAGVFALMQASLPSDERRSLWTVAADSKYLELRLIAAAHSGLPERMESIVDWEIVQYRYSKRVLATSPRAVTELSRIGVESEMATKPDRAVGEQPGVGMLNCWVPGAVSRRNQSGEVLRALTSCPQAHATFASEDANDEIWSGDSWNALRHSREVLGERVDRSDRPNSRPDVVVLGDPYALPDNSTRELVDDGIPVVVPTASASSVLWPGAAEWTDADDLVRLLRGDPYAGPVEFDKATPHQITPISSRASRISVGIPIFRDVRFLDECIHSLLAQTIEPLEILLVDDGSASEEVDEAISRWVAKDDRIRSLQTEHRGVCVARNTALTEMSGDAFVFVDSDDHLEPDFLERCGEVLRGDDSLWAVATWTRFVGAYEGIEAKPPFDARVGHRENPIISTFALVDMEVRDRGIRFEPDLAFLFCEDWHFWSQIVAAGGGIGLVPEPLANHRVHPTSGGFMRTELAHAIGKTRATEPLKNL